MTWYGDPDALDAMARRLGADAAGVRDRARTLVAAASATAWAGPAAEAFRRAVGDDAQDLRRAADGLDEASRALHAHADEVRERLAELARLAALAEDAAEWVGDRLEALR